MKDIAGFIELITVQGDVHTLLYSGVDAAGKAKLWTVQTSTNQASFVQALEGVPYVYYSGHANSGAGFALKAKADDPAFTPASIHTINDFMHLRNPQAAIPWRYFFTHATEYKDSFGRNAVADDHIPLHPANYNLPFSFSKPIEDGTHTANSERFPNNPSSPGANDHVPAGGTFTLQNDPTQPDPAGMDRFHMHTSTNTDDDDDDPEDLNTPLLIVNLENELKPKLGYQIFFANVCNGARDYSEVFRHGTFLSNAGFATAGDDAPRIFVETLVDGGGSQKILNKFIAKGYETITETNF